MINGVAGAKMLRYMYLCAAIELGQGEFGSVLKGTWRAPSGELVETFYVFFLY